MPGFLSNGLEQAVAARQDLSRFRYHTGATLRPLEADEPCPLLFRDIGVRALASFLRGKLRRLTGPTAPILYLRTSDYREPYVDYEQTGRLVFLAPRLFGPWHSGVADVFVASADHVVDPETAGFMPGASLATFDERSLAGVRDTADLREALGGRAYDQHLADSLAQLESLDRECMAAERLAEPVRRALQSPDGRPAALAREWMDHCAVTEHDLCAAWHHLPRDRRELLADVLPSFQVEVAGCS